MDYSVVSKETLKKKKKNNRERMHRACNTVQKAVIYIILEEQREFGESIKNLL